MKPIPIPDKELPPIAVRSVELAISGAVLAFSGRQPAGYHDPLHSHDRGQFSYRTEGFALVRVDGRAIFLSPGRGVWIPAGIMHEVTCRGSTSYNAFYVDRGAAPQPAQVRVITVSPLLHALVEAMMAQDEGEAEHGSRQRRLSDLILDEIDRAPEVGLMAPVMPLSSGLITICQQLSREPERPLDLDGWARDAGMSRRNFTRLFREETGLSPGRWHQQLRMHFADTWLAEDVPLQKISFRLGYGSAAAFSRAYARIFGAPPIIRPR